jgi:TRAP-type uncharacterized transport system fused permease subunit
VGVVALTVGFGGWLWAAADLPERGVAVAASLLLFYASPVADATGLSLFVRLLLWAWIRVRKVAARLSPA